MDPKKITDLNEAETAYERLQEEHRPIRQQLASDAGMSESTRRMLMEHLEEEEQEHEERIAELRAKGGSVRLPGGARGGSVGSLRNAGSGAPAARGTVGSLRRN